MLSEKWYSFIALSGCGNFTASTVVAKRCEKCYFDGLQHRKNKRYQDYCAEPFNWSSNCCSPAGEYCFDVFNIIRCKTIPYKVYRFFSSPRSFNFNSIGNKSATFLYTFFTTETTRDFWQNVIITLSIFPLVFVMAYDCRRGSWIFYRITVRIYTLFVIFSHRSVRNQIIRSQASRTR